MACWIQQVIIFCLVIAIILVHAAPAMAQSKPGAMNLIRDAETEANLKKLIFPILDVAGVDHGAFRLMIVQDDTLNAFVAGGQNIFINTGLLVRSESYSQLMGVIAHETGHIIGGHLARSQQALNDLSNEAILMQILAAAAMALGRGDAGAAAMGAGAQYFQRNILAFTRTQERSADQAGIEFLKELNVSPQGLLDFFKILKQEQKIYIDNKTNPYLLTHPLTDERIDAIASFIKQSGESAKPDNDAEWTDAHKRIRAKLSGYLLSPQRVMQTYPTTDNSLYARYARAIMNYKQGNIDAAIQSINQLINEYPDDPYFYELRGDIYLNGGDAKKYVDRYIADYEKALLLAPDQPLIRLGLVAALIESGRDADIKKAIPHSQEVLRQEPRYGLAWRMESIVQGKSGNIGKSALALSEMALLQGDKKRAKQQAERAMALLKSDPAAKQRAEDIKNQIQIDEKKS